jgi:hypothetical protein
LTPPNPYFRLFWEVNRHVDSNTLIGPKGSLGVIARVKGVVAATSGTWLGDALLLGILALGAIFVHLGIPGPVPTGADAGNWLAISNERLGNEVMSADVGYPPIFPGVVAVMLLIMDFIAAIVIAAIAAKVLLVSVVYVCARTLGRVYAFIAAAIVGVAGAQMDAYAWGGYAQLLGLAFGLLAVFLILRHIDTREPVHLWFGVAAAVATVLTHSLVRGLLVGAMILSIWHWLFIVDAHPRAWRFGMKIALAIALPAAIFALASIVVGLESGVEPVLNPFGEGRLDALGRAIRDAPLPWLVVGVMGIWTIFRRSWLPHVAATVAVGSSWALGGLGFFLLTGEPRALLVIQVGMVLLAVVGFASALEFVRARASARPTDGPRKAGYRAVLIVGISMLAGIVAGGLGAYVNAADWYRLVDTSELAALETLEGVSNPADLVVASIGHRGMPVGWWVEGYAERPTYSAHDERFLAFPDERDQAEIANRIFGGILSTEEVSNELVRIDAQYLVVDKRGPQSAWLQSEYARSLAVVHDDSNLVVLEVRSSE